MLKIQYNKLVQRDLNKAIAYYDEISFALGDDFYAELEEAIGRVLVNPNKFHFQSPYNLRRCNFKRFPYHFLFDTKNSYLRVWVLKHNKQRASFGVTRF